MSRVHQALQRAAAASAGAGAATSQPIPEGLLEMIQTIPYKPSPQAMIIDARHPQGAPAEEFRSLRTRLNHMQSQQPIHTAVITSPSPAEGKSFAAMNLALAEAELSGNLTLLCDFDLRRPVLHSLLQTDRGPGLSDFLQGKVPLHQAIRRVADSNLYLMPSGEPVMNPLELLNLKETRHLLGRLPGLFNWVILDTPPLLFAADANLLSTLCDGIILVVRIGATSVDSVTRAMQSLCENNVLGIVVNGARRGELYSRYTYYNRSAPPEHEPPSPTD